jgi:DNA-binding CsgD family transcriptional regulator/tetratricopeptide (TPR) repeat protein
MRQVLCPQLIGREEETALLGAALAAAQTGKGDAVLLLGEAGVGKSRLSREVERLARDQGVRILHGRATEGATGAYRPIAAALLSTLRSGETSLMNLRRLAELDPFQSILARLVPEWQDDGPTSGQIGSGSEDSTLLLGEAILRLLRAIDSGHGCLLVLEDLHWADAESLAVVEYLTDTLQSESVLLVATIRSDERSAAVKLARAMAARRVGQVIELERLDRSRINEMARTCLDTASCPPPIDDLLTLYTDGLPFLVEELLASWIDSGSLVPASDGWTVADELVPIAPRTFADTVNRRLTALGPETRRVLQLAALLGPHFDWTLLAAAMGLEDTDILDRLRAAIDAQLVIAGGAGQGNSTFGFRHALTRAAILTELLPPERASLATRLLALVDESHSGLPDEWCDVAASLAEIAGDVDRAARCLLVSGRRALAGAALTTAESILDRAAKLAPSDAALSLEIEEVLTEVLSLAGKWERVLLVGERMLAKLRSMPASEEQQAREHMCIARAVIAAGRWVEAEDHLAAARLLASQLHNEDVHARLSALSAHFAIERGTLEEAVAFAHAALDGAERAGLPGVACEALEVLGRCARVHDLSGAESAFERAHRIAERHGLVVWRLRALHELGTIDIFRDARTDRLVEARTLAVQAGALATAAMVDIQIAACLDQRGEFEAELQVAHRSEDLARAVHLSLTAAIALLFQAAAHAKQGNRAAMETAIAQALDLAGSEPDILAVVWEDRAFASLVDEKREQALGELEQAMAIVAGMPATTPGPFRGIWALLCTLESTDGPAACALVRDSGVTINPVNRSYVAYAEAISLGRSGRGEAASAIVARADADLPGLDWFRHLGHRLLAEAAIKDGWGHPVVWLSDAVSYFEEHRLHKLAVACRSLLRRAGVPPSHSARTHTDVPAPFRSLSITRREMEVLMVLAEGLSNREIGERLYLSPRTVEKHVASLMAKTETHTRSQLAALAVSAGVSSPPIGV